MSERYGLYRAKVVQRDDDRQRGRIKVQIPSVTGSGKTQWVEACMNVGYDNGGIIVKPKRIYMKMQKILVLKIVLQKQKKLQK